jgi:hypothetical protein
MPPSLELSPGRRRLLQAVRDVRSCFKWPASPSVNVEHPCTASIASSTVPEAKGLPVAGIAKLVIGFRGLGLCFEQCKILAAKRQIYAPQLGRLAQVADVAPGS